MDRLDKIAALAMTGLAIWALALVVIQEHRPDDRPPSPAQQAELRVDPALKQKLDLARTLLADNNIEQAQGLIAELIRTYPYEATPYLLQGDAFLYRQDVVAAMRSYRRAVDLNPDFLDKKSKLFQGKKIKKTVEDAGAAIESGLAARPEDERLLAGRKTYYYMLRKIAGSCG
ncbi:MAG: hypothetical protein M0T76_02065 [Desulfobacteraceae bacterium]|nr:hypothetical protein [Desulfobacteraceae bacterium]